MLYELVNFSDQIGILNVFRYITFRTGGAIFTALLFVMLFGPGIIDLLRVKQGKGQPIRDDGPKSHLSKVGTPTMGGLMIIAGVIVSTLLWANLGNPYIWIVLGVTLGYGAIGFYDDYLKVTRRTSSGFSSRMRLGLELLIAAIATGFVMYLGPPEISRVLTLPFFKNVVLDLGIFFVLVGVFVIAGAGNAVNLTDGLDGLAIVPVMIAAATFGLIAYLIGNAKFASYLQIHYRCRVGLPVVQCPARYDFHGRYGLIGPRRRTRRHRRRHQARNRPGHRRRPVRSGDAVGDHPGRLLQGNRQACLPNGTAASPLRAAGLAGIHRRRTLLDHFGDPGARRPRHSETALSHNRLQLR
jgi:hypothetical protein